MWHIAVAILMGSEVLVAWNLPTKYVNQNECVAKVERFLHEWRPSENSLHDIGYRCIHEPLEA